MTLASVIRRWSQFVAHLPAVALIALVRIYQYTLSPLIGRQCRFHPSCSNYMIGAVEKYGALRGLRRGLRRICRCHPWHPGGIDPP
jgi:putative membrane protein insertion efficiency factor